MHFITLLKKKFGGLCPPQPRHFGADLERGRELLTGVWVYPRASYGLDALYMQRFVIVGRGLEFSVIHAGAQPNLFEVAGPDYVPDFYTGPEFVDFLEQAFGEPLDVLRSAFAFLLSPQEAE